MARPTWINRAGGLDDAENLRLRAFESETLLLFTERPTLAEDAARLCALHVESGCAWIRRGQVLAQVPGRHPEERLR